MFRLSLNIPASTKFLRNLSRVVPNCPKPTYDTGCTFCGIPEFPPDKQINFEKSLNLTASQPWKYVLNILHGIDSFDQMPSKINLIPGSFANEFDLLKRDRLSPVHPVLVSNIITKTFKSIKDEKRYHVIVYPEGKLILFRKEHLPQFFDHYLAPDVVPVQSVYNPFKSEESKAVQKSVKSEGVFTEESVTKDLVLICGHGQRDIRCGKLGPVLEEEFIRVLKHENLEESVDVGMITHVGGHAYAGNLIYFPSDPKLLGVTWYGRVFPENVQGIVQETILGKKIISELYRGDLAVVE